ncbi:sensor histidine kinase [Pelagicoccus mobilis]|uniref:histidine kinase n=1 Tax=Pelagicoccus mobilis TaxID=415221 RepID=A0A934S315_9BACT|nr:HAMP domain-containing sensor histidine kinase [Pelagicoccus mobilis]MBK1880275.1 HAMP domain-containing histidine kinase [Pelagicoccus mobilis]
MRFSLFGAAFTGGLHLRVPGFGLGLVVLACSVFGGSAFAADLEKRILVVGSYVEESPFQSSFLEGFLGHVADEEIVVYREYMSVPAFKGEAHEANFERYLRSKYEVAPDLIVTIGIRASAWLDRLGDFHPETKRVLLFSGQNFAFENRSSDQLTFPLKGAEFGRTLELIDRLDRGAVIHVVYGEESLMAGLLKEALVETASEKGMLRQLHFISGDFETVQAELEGLASGSSVLFLPMYKGERGDPDVPHDVLERLAEGSDLRFYTLWDTLLGTGVLGGRMQMSRIVGARVAEQSLRLLKGQPLMDEARFYEGQAAFAFDDEVRRKLGIKRSQLPSDSLFVNERPRFFEKYFWESVIVGIVMAGLAVSTFVLRVLVKKRTGQLTRRNAALNEAIEKNKRLVDIGRGLSMLAHDLRSPIATIKSCCDVLEDDTVDGLDPKRIIRSMNSSSEKSLSMIGDMLDYVRTLEPKIERVSGKAFLALLESDIAQIPTGFDAVAMECRLEGECILNLDTLKISRAVTNLVKNSREALVSSETEDARILVSLKADEREAEITVSDNGPGISPDIAETLFEAFRTSGKKTGTGLGLAIAKDFVEAHGGSIRCESEPGNTVFRILLPNASVAL